VVGEVFAHSDWAEDNHLAQATGHTSVESYSDFWGIRNYAMARLLTREQVEQLTPVDSRQIEDTLLYLELRHTPSLAFPKPRFQEAPDGRIRLLLNPHVTVIPLNDQHVARLMAGMTTSRFVVEQGRASLYQPYESAIGPNSPLFSTIDDGIYEFIEGNAYKISSTGGATLLSRDHPLYKRTTSNVQRLFNIGIEFDTDYSPTKSNQVDFPSRYAFYRKGDLWVMGTPIFLRGDPTLQHFERLEEERERTAPHNRPYIAFRDYGPPLKQGKIDKRFIKNFGIKIPEGHYLMLGDNPSRSVDSRSFGFVPAANLQGMPSALLWPIGDRWGSLSGPDIPLATLPHTMALALIWLVCALIYAYYRWRMNSPVFQKIDFERANTSSRNKALAK
jgi:signal peptidase I